MQFDCIACNVKTVSVAAQEREAAVQKAPVRGVVEPARGAARMRERDQDTISVPSTAADRLVERDLPPKALDRKVPEQQQDRGTYQGDLADEPRRAVRDLRRARLAIARAARRFAGKALRDRGAIRHVIF